MRVGARSRAALAVLACVAAVAGPARAGEDEVPCTAVPWGGPVRTAVPPSCTARVSWADGRYAVAAAVSSPLAGTAPATAGGMAVAQSGPSVIDVADGARRVRVVAAGDVTDHVLALGPNMEVPGGVRSRAEAWWQLTVYALEGPVLQYLTARWLPIDGDGPLSASFDVDIPEGRHAVVHSEVVARALLVNPQTQRAVVPSTLSVGGVPVVCVPMMGRCYGGQRLPVTVTVPVPVPAEHRVQDAGPVIGRTSIAFSIAPRVGIDVLA